MVSGAKASSIIIIIIMIVQVNYPSADIPFTRITEYKHLPNQATDSGLLHTPCTTLVRSGARA